MDEKEKKAIDEPQGQEVRGNEDAGQEEFGGVPVAETPTLRERLVRLLEIEAPGSDFADDDVLFGRVIDDYADYARLLTERQDYDTRIAATESLLAAAEERLSHYDADVAAAELRGRNARIRAELDSAVPPSDGVPVLRHGVSTSDLRTASFFELAGGAN